jgi:hypothetical protein
MLIRNVQNNSRLQISNITYSSFAGAPPQMNRTIIAGIKLSRKTFFETRTIVLPGDVSAAAGRTIPRWQRTLPRHPRACRNEEEIESECAQDYAYQGQKIPFWDNMRWR